MSDHIPTSELQAWVDLEMAPEHEVALETHLEECDHCAERLEALSPDLSPFVVRLKQLDARSASAETLLDASKTNLPDAAEQNQDPLHLIQSDRWRLLRKLATGGIGEIWIAEDRLLGRRVAIKRLRKETAHIKSVQQRFLYEARTTAQLSHPGIVQIFDLIEDGPNSYYAMTLINGQTLLQRIQKAHRIQLHRQAPIGSELIDLLRSWTVIANTVAFAHSKRVLHRDLKSDNVIVGDFSQVTLIDWGLAKRKGESSQSKIESSSRKESISFQDELKHIRRTNVGVRLGTPAFMAPEQASGDVNAIDERTDTYALAAMLYEILTGAPPFDGPDAETIMRIVQNQTLVPPNHIVSMVPERLNEICIKGLSKNPSDRFQTAADLAIAVEDWMTKEAAKRQTDLARQKLFDLSDDIMMIMDQRPQIIWANSAWERLLGWHPDQLLDGSPSQFVHPDELELDKEVFEKLARYEQVSSMKRRIRAKDGTYRWFSWTATPLPDEEITIAIGRDIEELVREKNDFAFFLDAAPEAIVVVNLDRTIHQTNCQALEMFGYQDGELIGKVIETLIPKRYHTPLFRFFEMYVSSPETKPLLTRDRLHGCRQDGSEFPLGIRLSPVKSNDGYRIVSSIRKVETKK